MAWVASALSKDLPNCVAMPSHVDGIDIALWRSASGKVQAWADRCPHRGMRLSHGFVRGETLACIYHGWRYNSSGACSHIPAHPNLEPPKTITATSYPVVEANGVIWTAAAENEGAPPALSDLVPLRSLQVHRSAFDIAAGLGGRTDEPIWADEIALLLQPIGASCTLHALAREGTDKKAASAQLENLRRQLERVCQ